MLLSDFEFKGSYNRIDDDIAGDFYIPCMMNSISYDRISGFFGSTIYVIAWKALKAFLSNAGTMRIICSPIISPEDVAAMEEGNAAQNDDLLAQALERELEEITQDENLDLPSRLLSCLIANGTIKIKIAVVNKNGHPNIKALFHDKIGIFYDAEGNRVGFRGSFNETFKGLSNDGNIESTDVFQSWDGGKELERIETSANLFERIWKNKVRESVAVYEIPEAINKKILQNADKKDIDQLLDEIKVRVSAEERWKPDPKGRTPRKHQVRALNDWENHSRRGVLKHATGSGKTFTAICAIADALKRGETVLVLVPSKELLYQWRIDLEKSISTQDINFLLCGDGNNTWRKPQELAKWTRANSSINKIIIAIMSTASSEEFYSNVEAGNHLFLVADEVHNLGSAKRRNVFNINAGARLGLSATPERYGDREGTEAIFTYFGGIIQPEISLDDAIKSHVLTRYFYHPNKVYLNSYEMEEWEKISKEISKIIARSTNGGKLTPEIIKANPHLSQLMINRARILKNAANKAELAIKILKENFKPGQKWIVYCDNQTQLKEIRQRAEDADLDAYEYYAEMDGDRTETLRYFERHGGVLVSIKCLDEGVDIPSTTHALILASSKNPREFIQRRGRVLRLSPGKPFAHLYDAITLPMGELSEEEHRADSIVLGELSRAIQFGTWAENPSCITDLKIIALDYGIDYNEYLTGGSEDEDE